MRRIFWGFSFFSYMSFLILFWIAFTVTTYFWFKAETSFTNNSEKPVTISVISRNTSGSFFITQKNGIFPIDPSHSYGGIYLLPGRTAKLTWDWDDQIIHGFYIVNKEGVSYMQIDFRNPKDCCYIPAKREYALSPDSILNEVPGPISQLDQFKRTDRWKSLFTWNSLAALFWGLLLLPLIFFFKKAFGQIKTLESRSRLSEG